VSLNATGGRGKRCICFLKEGKFLVGSSEKGEMKYKEGLTGKGKLKDPFAPSK